MPGVREYWAALAARLRLIRRLPELEDRLTFHDFELRRLNEQLRSLHAAGMLLELDRAQTKSSFDFQWKEVADGEAMPSNPDFLAGLEDTICTMTGLDREWFKGKRVADIGCGRGRFTYGLLQLGAHVTACDQSDWGLKRTQELCADHADRLETKKIDLLTWDELGDFDLVWCFGVVHHTGNTYLAVKNVAQKVKPGGRLFLMVYGWPSTRDDLIELNTYEDLRQSLRLTPMPGRLSYLEARYGREKANGYFDAISPRINDLLTFEELGDLLARMGFSEAQRTLPSRNIHLIADRQSEDAAAQCPPGVQSQSYADLDVLHAPRACAVRPAAGRAR